MACRGRLDGVIGLTVQSRLKVTFNFLNVYIYMYIYIYIYVYIYIYIRW